jgi:O-antigen ligase
MEYTWSEKVSKFLFLISCLLIIYMPLHVFIAQSASLITGGLEVWKAIKDVLLVGLVPLMLYLAYVRGLFQNKTFRHLIILAGIYTLLHMLFVVFDKSDDTYSAIVGSVYNTRLFGYLLLGYLVGSAREGQKYLSYLLTLAVIVAAIVALFGVAQYFLPTDFLTNFGYSLERGVKPLFFIDDRVELPRVMSTLKDPNSLGAYMILPILATGLALFSRKANETLFIRSFRREALVVMLVVMLLALFLTFSRGALLGLVLSIITLLCIVTGERVMSFVKKYFIFILAFIFLISFFLFQIRNHSFVQDYVFHAAVSTNQEDPNEKRLSLQQDAINDIVDNPEGSGPGSAGLVSINNPQGGVLTENYYLQIAYEVGWLGVGLFVVILLIITKKLLSNLQSPISNLLLSSLVAYLFYSLLIHLWSNEAVALQWWLLSGTALGLVLTPKAEFVKN